jgi:hypothetical protein
LTADETVTAAGQPAKLNTDSTQREADQQDRTRAELPPTTIPENNHDLSGTSIQTPAKLTMDGLVFDEGDHFRASMRNSTYPSEQLNPTSFDMDRDSLAPISEIQGQSAQSATNERISVMSTVMDDQVRAVLPHFYRFQNTISVQTRLITLSTF